MVDFNHSRIRWPAVIQPRCNSHQALQINAHMSTRVFLVMNLKTTFANTYFLLNSITYYYYRQNYRRHNIPYRQMDPHTIKWSYQAFYQFPHPGKPILYRQQQSYDPPSSQINLALPSSLLPNILKYPSYQHTHTQSNTELSTGIIITY
jgi:hypothetical protein